MRTLAWGTALLGVALAAASCGGNVVVDAATTSGSSTTTEPTGSTTGTTSTVTTTTSSTTTTTSAPCGTFVYSSHPDCQSCAASLCCDQLAACDVGTDCNALYNCLVACNGEQGCAQMCLMGSAAGGLSALQNIASCYENNCAWMPPCQSTPACQVTVDAPTPECSACLGSKCCVEFQDCLNDPGSPGAEACYACYAGQPSNPAACTDNPIYNAALSCEYQQCPTECNGGICDTGLTTANGPCDGCLTLNCCAVLKACVADAGPQGCLESCLLGPMPGPNCQNPQSAVGKLYLAAQKCWNANCSGPDTCDVLLP